MMRRTYLKLLGSVGIGLTAIAVGRHAHANLLAEWPSPYGIGSSHVNQRTVRDLHPWLPKLQTAGVTNLRTVNVPWHELETVPGRWNWAALDEQVAYLQKLGMPFGLMLWGNPTWNKLDPGWRLPVNNRAAWQNYVSQVVRRTQGKAVALEVWNEPPNFIGEDQTAIHYAQLVVATAQAARAIDPQLKVGLAAKSVHIHFLEQTILAGAKDHFDFVVLHPYEVLDAALTTSRSDKVYLNIVSAVRRMLEAHNPSKRSVPIIFTELGVDSRKGEGVQADALVKAYVMGIAQGVANIQWFEGMDGDSGPLGLLRQDASPRQSYFALTALTTHLGRSPRFIGRVPFAEEAVGFVFEGPKGQVMVAWGPVGNAVQRLALPPESLVAMPANQGTANPAELALGPSPVIVVRPPQPWVDIATKYPAGSYLPGEDFSQAKEVSIRFGRKPVFSGIHTLAAGDVSAAVEGYGGNARSGGLPGGNLFVVDPSFLSYRTGPIEITAVVRRSSNASNAGFNLLYEAVEHSGFKTHRLGWYTVPPGPSWHTKTWRLDDASFVGYWGYHFALVSDSPAMAGYEIQRVSVRRLH